jgi:phosphate-selective porin OprO and OprP
VQKKKNFGPNNPSKIPCMHLRFLLLVSLSFVFSALCAQDTTSTSFGNGLINVVAKDSSWSTKSTFRVQTQYEGVLTDDNSYTDRYRVRRGRIKGNGWVGKDQKIKYKYEYDMVNGQVLDAVLRYEFAKNWEIWIGQTKLPGNIERVISSQSLQLVDRSILNARFNLDRDGGLQLHHTHFLGSVMVKEKLAFSQGEGLNSTNKSKGSSYTASLEIFPFGNFEKARGEYKSSDLRRTKTPKLMLGFVFDHNEQAIRSQGHIGSYFSNASRNLATVMADAHLKYKGLSIMLEYAQRYAENSSPVIAPIEDDHGTILVPGAVFYTGYAANAQAGYLFKSFWEIAGRFTMLRPEDQLLEDNKEQYTLGVSRYVYGHNLKIQTDASLLQEANGSSEVMFRLQTEFTF